MSRSNTDVERGLALLAMMERIRAFEETARLAAVRDGLVLGAIHLSTGQEGVPVGLMPHLAREDLLLSTHRGHGHTLAKGADPVAMMKELLGREGGCCGGKGGSMHIADFGVGMLGANGVVAANITIAAGAAHGISLLGDGRIVACVFGDGAVNRGPFLEGLNWAGVFGLPILFLCEDNRYSASTRTDAMTSGGGGLERARAMGLRASEVDGNDVLAVWEACAEITARIRRDRVPEYLHARTYRTGGHTYFDPATYRPEGEAEAEARGDPVARQRAALTDAGVDAPRMDALREEAEREMAEALREAAAAPWPAPEAAFADVQDAGAPAEPWP